MKGKSNESVGKSRDKRKSGKVAFGEQRFVRIEPTAAEKEEFRALRDAGEFDDLDVDGWLEAGYKLSINREERGGGRIATLTGQFTDMLNAGLVLSARGSSAALALAFLDFKDRYLCGEAGWKAAEDLRGGSYDDIG